MNDPGLSEIQQLAAELVKASEAGLWVLVDSALVESTQITLRFLVLEVLRLAVERAGNRG